MTDLLQKAFEEAQCLAEHEQDRIAQWLIEEIRAEHEWDKSFARSQDTLEGLANDALAEHRTGKSEPLDPDAI